MHPSMSDTLAKGPSESATQAIPSSESDILFLNDQRYAFTL